MPETQAESEDDYPIGGYVLVEYDEVHYPGIVCDVSNENGEKAYLVNVMYTTKGGFFWPDKEDKVWYKVEAIRKTLQPPIPVSHRGVWQFENDD